MNTTQQPITLQQQVVNDIGSVRNLRNIAKNDEQAALKEAAKAFEAMFLQLLLKEARNAKLDDGFGEGVTGANSMEKYEEWRDDQLAQDLSAKGSMGIADMLLKQLAPKFDRVSTEPTESSLMDQQSMPNIPRMTAFTDLPISSGRMRETSMSMPSMADLTQLDSIKDETGVMLPSTSDTILLRNLLRGKAH